MEAALWAALEVLEERSEALQRIAHRMGTQHARSAERFQDGAREALARAELIRRALALRRVPAAGVREASAG